MKHSTPKRAEIGRLYKINRIFTAINVVIQKQPSGKREKQRRESALARALTVWRNVPECDITGQLADFSMI